MPRRNLCVLLLAIAVCYACYVRADQTPFARHLANAYRTIDRLSLQDPPDRALFDSAIEGMVAELDRRGDFHSEYITASEAASFDAEMRQEFGGIGVVIAPRGEGPARELIVVSPPEPGQPAALHDIRARDRILAIDGKRVADLSTYEFEDVVNLIRGPVGKPVRLTILHADETEPVDVEIVRGLIETESVKGLQKMLEGGKARWRFLLDDHPRIGYVRITTFGEKTLVELQSVLEQLVAAQVRGVVLDLRQNAGGELSGTIAICDMFLPAGKVIVQTRDRRKRIEDVYRSSRATPFPDLPLAVLINRFSASASEIVAACLQDHQRAAVIGERSFGKGTVQTLLNVGPPVRQHDELRSGLLKLTAASFWRPSGKNIHRMPGTTEDDDWGVAPDPGMHVQLDDHHYAAYLLDLYQRDVFDPNGDAVLDRLETAPPEVQELLPFEDEALAKAVNYLNNVGKN